MEETEAEEIGNETETEEESGGRGAGKKGAAAAGTGTGPGRRPHVDDGTRRTEEEEGRGSETGEGTDGHATTREEGKEEAVEEEEEAGGNGPCPLGKSHGSKRHASKSSIITCTHLHPPTHPPIYL